MNGAFGEEQEHAKAAISLSPGAFIVVALIALLPLLAISTAAPGGESWRWLEYPRPTSTLALGVAVLCCALGPRTGSWRWVALAAIVGSLVYEQMEVPGWDPTFGDAIQRLSTLVIAVFFGALVVLAATIKHPKAWLAAGLWLAVLGLCCVWITVANHSWYTLENYTHPGHLRSSARWPDTKKIAIVVSSLAAAVGALVATIAAWPRRTSAPTIPRATLRR